MRLPRFFCGKNMVDREQLDQRGIAASPDTKQCNPLNDQVYRLVRIAERYERCAHALRNRAAVLMMRASTGDVDGVPLCGGSSK